MCDCENEEEPCAICRREIHEAWHEQGFWWIRTEECTPNCQQYANGEMLAWQQELELTARERAINKQQNRGGPF